MKSLVLATLLLFGCADNSQVNVQGEVKIEGIDTQNGKALVDIGDFEVLYIYGSEDGQVKYLEPVSVMQDQYLVKDWYIDKLYIQGSVKLINRELGK